MRFSAQGAFATSLRKLGVRPAVFWVTAGVCDHISVYRYASDLWRFKEGRRGDMPRGQAQMPPPARPPPGRSILPVLPPQLEHATRARAAQAQAQAAVGGELQPYGGAHAADGAGALVLPGKGALPPGAWNYGSFESATLEGSAEAAADHILSELREKALQCAWKFEGSAAREAAARLGCEHITPLVIDALTQVTRWLRNLMVEWGQQHATVLSWLRRLSNAEHAEEAKTCAWVALTSPSAQWSLDSALQLIASLSQTSVAACFEKSKLPGVSAAEAAWLAEFGDGSLQGLEVTSRLQALLQQFKFAPLGSFLSVAARILELGMLSTSAVAANFDARLAWMKDMVTASQKRMTDGKAAHSNDTASSGRPKELPPVFEFKGFPSRAREGGVLLLEQQE